MTKTILLLAGLLYLVPSTSLPGAERFDGQFYRGEGDAEYLEAA